MVESSATAETGSGSRRRRKRGTPFSRGPRWYAPEQVRKVLPWLALAFGVIWLVMSAKQFFDGYVYYGLHIMGQTKEETLYGFDRPQKIRGPNGWEAAPQARAAILQSDMWRYDLAGGGTLEVAFDAGNRMRMISCGGRGVAPPACPTSFGVALGDDELDMVYKLGRARNETFSATAKTAHYPSLGLSLYMEQFRVTRITLKNDGGGFAAIGRYLRWALP